MNEVDLENCFKFLDKGDIEFFKSLSPEEREYALSVIEQSGSGNDDMINALYNIDYHHKVVDPETFFTHPDYMGHFRSEIYDAWWPHLLKMCNVQNGIFEIVLTGSLGIGKSTISSLIATYHLHRVLCLREPASFYKLGKGSKIVFGIYSLSLQSAEDVGFFILRDQLLAESPFFNDVYRRDPRGVDNIKFPKNVVVLVGSQVLHAAGKNMIFVAVDEMNLMKQGATTANKAFDLANAVSRRIESRFMQSGGEIPGCAIFIGSAASETDFIAKRIRKVRKSPGKYVVEGAFWNFVKKIEYCGEKFRVQVGGEFSDNKVLDEVKKIDGGWRITKVLDPDVGADVIMVPVEHFSSFDVDVDGSLKDIAGVSTKSFMKLFANREKLSSAFDRSMKRFFNQDIVLGYLGGPNELATMINVEVACKMHMSHYVPRRHPGAPRYLHVDLAKNEDIAGIAMVHPSSHFVITEQHEDDHYGVGLYDITKEVEVDFVLGVCWGPKKERIDFANIRRLVFFLRRLDFWIRWVGHDNWQSEDSIQRYQEAKINAGTQSVDRDSQPYLITRNAVYSGKVRSSWNELLYDELSNLDHDSYLHKVDHPANSSKDLADAFAGAIYRCLIDKISPQDAMRHNMTTGTAESPFDPMKLYENCLEEMKKYMEILK